MKKVFLQTQFGSPHPWTQQYLDHVGFLEQYGWYWKVFTPNPLTTSSGNVEIVPMDLRTFDVLISKYCNVQPANFLTAKGVPDKLVSDYYPAYGQIFQDYIQGCDFWGHTNWDMVYGRLDHFVPDATLEECDIWSDDVNSINGIFCLYRNNEYVNNLFREVPDWRRMFTDHRLWGFDEIHMTYAARRLAAEKKIRFKYPMYYPNHSYDRLTQHTPLPNLRQKEDGALIEVFEDSLADRLKDYPMFPGHFGREIASFHFIRTKVFPEIKR